jgi:hypothetical protein
MGQFWDDCSRCVRIADRGPCSRAGAKVMICMFPIAHVQSLQRLDSSYSIVMRSDEIGAGKWWSLRFEASHLIRTWQLLHYTRTRISSGLADEGASLWIPH